MTDRLHKSRRRPAGLLLAAAVLAMASPAVPAASETPAETRPMTAVELYTLYRNKSWQWTDGAGYMNGEDRSFAAWVDGPNGKSWGEGRWVITETGRMCLKATWHTQKGVFPAKTCFSHRIGKEGIYQRREPDGTWYVFRHETIQDGDEARKLVSADLVSGQREDVKSALAAIPVN